MKCFNDAWNCFPQKILDGKSPQDLFFDEKMKEDNKSLTKEEQMIKEHYDYAMEHLDEYIDWVSKECLPKYESYLKNDQSKDWDSMVGVAGVFLEMCGRLGFFKIHNLDPRFIEDFPNMFRASVIGPEISKKEIAGYLKNFLEFISIYYPLGTLL